MDNVSVEETARFMIRPVLLTGGLSMFTYTVYSLQEVIDKIKEIQTKRIFSDFVIIAEGDIVIPYEFIKSMTPP